MVDQYSGALNDEVSRAIAEKGDRILRKLSDIFSENTAFLVDSILSTSPRVQFSEPFYKWRLMHNDPDDNKFADMAVPGHADYLVTNDKHFDILKELEFPKVNIISLDNLKKMIY